MLALFVLLTAVVQLCDAGDWRHGRCEDGMKRMGYVLKIPPEADLSRCTPVQCASLEAL